MSSEKQDRLDGLIRLALSCDWRPQHEEDFRQTQACAEPLLQELVRMSFERNGRAGDRLPPNVLECIFSLSIAASGHAARANIRDVSRKFRCVVLLSQELWSDVTTLPTHPPAFMMALARTRWTGATPRLHLDNSNVVRRGLRQSHLPSSPLLLTALGSIRSLIVEHKMADVEFLRHLHNQCFFPELEKLVLSSGDAESWGPLPLIFDPKFTRGVPAIEAPRLHTVHLRTVLLHLPSTRNAVDLLLSGRTRGTSFRPRLWNKWPVNMVHGLLARNSSLTVLRLIEVIRTETIDDIMDTISLPSLQVLVVCSPSAKEPVWVLDTIDFPIGTHLSFHIGHRALSSFDKSQFYHTLGRSLKQRRFRCVTAVSSLNLSGVLLSAKPRLALPLPKFDDTDSYLRTTEIAHTSYEGAPGAVDVFIAYQSVWIPDTPWHDIYSSLSPYVKDTRIRYLEINAEAELYLHHSLLRASQFDFTIKEMRLWNPSTRFCAWDSLVKGLTGWMVPLNQEEWDQPDEMLSDDTLSSDAVTDETVANQPPDEPAVRHIVEQMLCLFPDTKRIYDCGEGQLWSYRRTLDLVEAVHRSRVHD